MWFRKHKQVFKIWMPLMRVILSYQNGFDFEKNVWMSYYLPVVLVATGTKENKVSIQYIMIKQAIIIFKDKATAYFISFPF